MNHPEFELQKRVCSYLKIVHPRVLFMSDTIANVKLNAMQAKRNSLIQKRGFKTPDIIVFEPRGNYHGLFIELKTESPYKLNGDIKSNEHIKAQYETIQQLKQLGYYADFQWEYNSIVKLIDWYLNQN